MIGNSAVKQFKNHFKLLATAVLAIAFLSGVLWQPGAALAGNDKKVTPKKVTSQKKQASKKTKSAKTKTSTTKKQAKKQPPAYESMPWPDNIKELLGQGAVVVYDPYAPKGKPKLLFSHNADKKYVPASILKIITSAAALELLGPDFRFKTEFFLTKDKDLWVVGYGDPYLVTEELASIAGALKKAGVTNIRHIGLDNSYFTKGLILDGNSQTNNPYDAFNNAIGVNFNTVGFKKDKKGQVLEIGDGTPLTPLAKQMAQNKKPKRTTEYRLNINQSPQHALEHAGQAFQAIFEKEGLKVSGQVKTGEAPKNKKLIYTHESSLNLESMVRELLKFSNNYITNQIFLTMGAELYGAPATVEKSRKAMKTYFQKFDLPAITMHEGSGLSLLNSLSANDMIDFLAAFESNRHLCKYYDDEGLVLAKTGTMNGAGIHTLAGYMERTGRNDEPLHFVILLNGQYPPGTRNNALKILKDQFLSSPEPKK